MGRLFGTDGVRGIANLEPITVETSLRIGRAIAHICRENSHRPKVVVGKDTRLSGYMLESALVAGITSMGADAWLLGPLPTPGVAFITRDMRADAGIMLSASHNPYHDNGIKVFSHDGFKLPDEKELQIERLVYSDELRPIPQDIGKAYRIDDAVGRYVVFLKHTFPDGMTLEGMKIVVDCAHGATYKAAPAMLRELGAELVELNVKPDGTNINAGCGALHPQWMARAVVETSADLGLAFDGDGDRLIAVDERGRVLNGDVLLAICAKDLKDRGLLRNNLVISTVMSNVGLSIALAEMGIRNLQSKVGDRYVLEMMLQEGAVFGGEQCGHIIFLDHHTTGDGMVTALQLLAILVRTGAKLSELATIMTPLPQTLINVEVRCKPELSEVPEIIEAICRAEQELAGEGRVLVRYSGTENVCRVMVEGPSFALIDRLARDIAAVVEEKLYRSIDPELLLTQSPPPSNR